MLFGGCAFAKPCANAWRPKARRGAKSSPRVFGGKILLVAPALPPKTSLRPSLIASASSANTVWPLVFLILFSMTFSIGFIARPNGVVKTSFGRWTMCSGIFFPTKNSQHSSEKLLQLCSNKLYVPTLNRGCISSRNVWNNSSSTCVSPIFKICFGMPNCVCFGIPTCIPWPNQYSFPKIWTDVCHTPSIFFPRSCSESAEAKPSLF